MELYPISYKIILYQILIFKEQPSYFISNFSTDNYFEQSDALYLYLLLNKQFISHTISN